MFRMSSKLYDVLKVISRYILPSIGTLYFALAGTWGLPYGEEVVGTMTALVTFVNAILGISQYRYNRDEEIVKDEMINE